MEYSILACVLENNIFSVEGRCKCDSLEIVYKFCNLKFELELSI